MFLYTGESVRFNKNAHCFAVEPSGWRFTFDASIFASLLRHDVPFDSPRVHQKTTATAVVFCIRGSPCVLIKTHTASQSNPPGYPKRAEGTHRAAGSSLLPKAKTSHHRFCAQDSFVFSPRKNRPKYGRFFVVWIYCFLLNNALLILLLFVEQCFDCGN